MFKDFQSYKKIYIACGYTDLRYGVDGIACLVQEAFKLNPYGEGKWKEMPEETIYKLEHHPASFEAVTYHIHVYAKDDNQTIVRAPKPTELL